MATKYMTAKESTIKSTVDLGDGTTALRIAGSINVGGSRAKLKSTQDLSVAPFLYTTSLSDDFKFRGLTLSFTDGTSNRVDISEDVEIWMDDADNNFDVPIMRDNTLDSEGNLTDSFVFFPDSDITIFGSYDTQLQIKVSNDNLNGIVNMILYVEVLV